MDKSDNTLKPVHNALQTLGSSSTHSASIPEYELSLTSFTALASSATGSSHSSFKTSGYIYINTAVSQFVKQFDDVIDYTDSLINLLEESSEPVQTTDSLLIYSIDYKYLEEAVSSTDDQASLSLLGETITCGDSLTTTWVKTFTDVISYTDTVIGVNPFSATGTLRISNTKLNDVNSSYVVSVDSYEDSTGSMDIATIIPGIAAVTNASSEDNPFLPTIILDGITYVTNACTAPPPGYVVTPTTNYINYINSPIGASNFCSMTNSQLNLTSVGGSFTVATQQPLGATGVYQNNLGQTVSIYGLLGTVVDFGKAVDSSSNTFITSGIFGTPFLNKPFNLVTYGNTQYFSFLSSQNNLSLAPQVNSYTTIKGMAQGIANLCGIQLSWLIPDAPYHDIFGQSGLTGLEALNTLANQMGGQLLWSGDLNYIVAYPDYSFGAWSIPDSKLLSSSGIRYNYHLDLGYGVSGSGVLGIPTNVFFDTAEKTIPDTVDTQPEETIEKIGTVTKAFTIDDPTLIIPLPNDIVSVKIQILVNTGGVGAQYVTTNPSIWYDLGSPGLGNPYVRIVKNGNSYQNQLWANYTLFPSLAAINNGNFVMSFGIVRRSLNPQFQEATVNTDLLRRELQAKILANIKFIKTYSATVSCQFFGSLPLPGMSTTITYCGETITGVIESVSVSGSGIVTVEIAQYVRINLLDRKLQMDLLNGNFGNI